LFIGPFVTGDAPLWAAAPNPELPVSFLLPNITNQSNEK
jgi:hypothetical protein